MEYNNLSQFGVYYEMSLDMYEHQRQIYGILDWLSDCGGLASSLIAILGIFSKIMMYQLLDYYMVTKLYTKQDLERNSKREDQMEGGSRMFDKEIKSPKSRLNLKSINIFKTNLIRLMPKRLNCSRFLKKDEKLFVHGLKRYHK